MKRGNEVTTPTEERRRALQRAPAEKKNFARRLSDKRAAAEMDPLGLFEAT